MQRAHGGGPFTGHAGKLLADVNAGHAMSDLRDIVDPLIHYHRTTRRALRAKRLASRLTKPALRRPVEAA
ncbi:MAG: hypothetical protein A4E19_16735 [Nitrospira sp. SG-bin1]|nr:MAG: hypothetical protein A4E19_16735 [Nitrospira sp. SG-bin1]